MNDKDTQLKNNKDRDRMYKKFSDEQKEFFKSIQENIFTFCEATAGSGKAQPLYSKVLTPDGFIKMGDIKNSIKVKESRIELLKKKSHPFFPPRPPTPTLTPRITEGAPNVVVSTEDISDEDNEVMIYCGAYNFDVSVVGKHSVPCQLTSKFLNTKSKSDTRLSSHHQNFKTLLRFAVNNDELKEFVNETAKIDVMILAGKTEFDEIGYFTVNLSPFNEGMFKFTQRVDIFSMEKELIGNITIECACRKDLI